MIYSNLRFPPSHSQRFQDLHGQRTPPPRPCRRFVIEARKNGPDGGLTEIVGYIIKGFFTLSLASSVAIRALQAAAESERSKLALSCKACKGKGFYSCKLCKGSSTIQWSPLHDSIIINPYLCPTWCSAASTILERNLHECWELMLLYQSGWGTFSCESLCLIR